MEEALTKFLWNAVLPFLWLVGLPLTINLAWIREKAINFSYVAFLILGIYFAILYFQGSEWTVYAWIVIVFLFYFVDRKFSLYYDFWYMFGKRKNRTKMRKNNLDGSHGEKNVNKKRKKKNAGKNLNKKIALISIMTEIGFMKKKENEHIQKMNIQKKNHKILIKKRQVRMVKTGQI